MDNILDGYFYNPSRGNLEFREVLLEIAGWMKEKPEKSYEIIVGCDSSSEEEPTFPVAVVILRSGEGGRFFLKKVRYPASLVVFGSWRQRVLQEVVLSCELALTLREALQNMSEELSGLNYQFRYIHADVGENGRTRDMIREVVGLIRGNGFEPKIKPESYAASVVADRYS